MAGLNVGMLESLLPRVLELAREAGRLAAKYQPVAGQSVETKGDGSPVTMADRAAHECIEAGLLSLEPRLPVLSEEGDLAEVESGAWERFWLVDPLDGTRDFLAGLAEYTVNIALVEQGEPLLGVVVAPSLGTAYYSARSLGAWKQAGAAPPVRIVSRAKDGGMRAAISRSHGSKSTDNYLARLGVTETIRSGSSIKICLVAEGTADIYPRLGPTSIWDTGAGVAVAREAGCEVTDLSGKRLGFDPAGGILQSGFIVSAPGLIGRALDALR